MASFQTAGAPRFTGFWYVQRRRCAQHVLTTAQIGTNDYERALCNTDAIVACTIRVVQEIQEHKPDATIILNSLLPRGLGSHLYAWEDFSLVNRELECYARGHKRVGFFNATNLFVHPLRTGGYGINMTRLPDGLHPTAEGSRVWGTEIVKRVKQIVGH